MDALFGEIKQLGDAHHFLRKRLVVALRHSLIEKGLENGGALDEHQEIGFLLVSFLELERKEFVAFYVLELLELPDLMLNQAGIVRLDVLNCLFQLRFDLLLLFFVVLDQEKLVVQLVVREHQVVVLLDRPGIVEVILGFFFDGGQILVFLVDFVEDVSLVQRELLLVLGVFCFEVEGNVEGVRFVVLFFSGLGSHGWRNIPLALL